ncbi:FecR family protein [Chitinophaga sp. MM2321]|uniref:FecR family protein n=1 Tax=Chitinophaga sp. MM2321 TaxID=3137178 RepID=UPI0032D585B4
MKGNTDISRLLQGHINGSLTNAEKEQLLAFLSNLDNVEDNMDAINSVCEQFVGGPPLYLEGEVEEMIQQIIQTNNIPLKTSTNPTQTGKVVFLRGMRWFKYVAAALVILLVGYYLWPNAEKTKTDLVQQISPSFNDTPLVSGSVLLTLSNGEKVALSKVKSQSIKEGDLHVKNENGTLTYEKSNVVVYNTVSTPKGVQFNLSLSDGTVVQLNAASSITFPTSFSGENRVVRITGEAYFEVAKNSSHPFIVETYKDKITVLGTHFNVNAYPEEEGVKTSLAEGKVRVNNTVLVPGEAYKNNEVMPTNIAQDLAWKNMVFDFNQCDLKAVMRQISRWYDVDIVYTSVIPSMRFYGKMGRDLTLVQILSILEKSDVHFKIEGKKLIVSK